MKALLSLSTWLFSSRAFPVVTAANEAPAPVATCAANVAPIGGDEWIDLVPYGRHQTGIVNDKKAAGTVQVFERPQADTMVASFNSLIGKVGRFFRGAPIYVGHPDLDAKRWPDDSRYGKITELRAADNCLQGKVVWNAKGQENQKEGYWVYPSIAWDCIQKGRELHPVSLRSVGLTNDPNIDGVAPVTANAAPPADQTNTDNNTTMKLPPWLTQLLGLAEDATEEDCKACLTTKLTANAKPQPFLVKVGAEGATEISLLVESDVAIVGQLQTDLTAANARVAELDGLLLAANTARDTAQTALTAANAARAEVCVREAIRLGKATGAEKDTLIAAFNANPEAAEADLAKRQQGFNTKPLDTAGRKQQEAGTAELRTKFTLAVNARVNGGQPYHDAYCAEKAKQEFAPLFTTATT